MESGASSGKKHKKSKIDWPRTIIGTVLLMGMAILIYILLSGKTTTTSTVYKQEPYKTMTCTASNLTGIVETVGVGSPTEKTYKVRAIFNGDEDNSLKEINVSFEGTYNDKSAAEGASSSMHADYNIYMGKAGVDAEKYVPTFNYIDNVAKYNLYAKGNLVQVAYTVFLINDKSVSLNLTGLKSVYLSEGFKCEIVENNNE